MAEQVVSWHCIYIFRGTICIKETMITVVHDYTNIRKWKENKELSEQKILNQDQLYISLESIMGNVQLKENKFQSTEQQLRCKL
jgi:hypothetical protein